MIKKAYLAGGCFWSMEELFRKLRGIVDTKVGFTGGINTNPTWYDHPGHAETLEITYDPNKISYTEILDFFFRIHDPTTLNRQGNDIGTSYRSAIFYQDEAEKQKALEFIEIVNKSAKWINPVVTTLEKFSKFYPAEEIHQDYLQKYPSGYTCHFIRGDSYL